MKTMSTLMTVFAMLMALQASAILSPEPDQLGLYFDVQADEVCLQGAGPYSTHNVYLIYTNPTPGAILAVNAGYDLDGNAMVLSTVLPGNPIIIPDPGNLGGNFNGPESTSEAMVLSVLSVLYMSVDDDQVDFFLGSFGAPHGGTPEVQWADGTWHPTEMIFPNGSVMASINAQDCGFLFPVATEECSFGALKSLYR
ncbi:MAG: hypothetical protein GY780_04775 [bacterium]|nr:hypothetical protein [bacterium]